MAGEVATWSVELKNGVGGPAAQAARALEQLKGKIQADTKELREMQAAMSRLRQGTTVNASAVKELTERISAKKAAIASAQESFLRLGGTFGQVSNAANAAGPPMSQLLGVMVRAQGPVGSLAGRAGTLIEILGIGLVGASLAAAAAVAALGAALAAGYVALARYALASSGARRDELLHLEALTKLPNWYGLAAGKATDLQRAIDDVSSTSALGRGDVAKYAEELYRMGLRGKNLATALDATSIKASTQGERWASLFMQQAAGANILGQSVDKLAARVKNQLGGIARQQALSLDVQMRKLRENVGRIFDGVNIGPFLAILNDVLKLFGQNEVIGRSLRVLISTMFDPLAGFFGGSTAMIAKRFFQGMVIAALQLTIVILTVRNRLREAFGGTTLLGNVDTLTVALWAGYSAAAALALGMVLLAGAVAIVAAPFVLAGAAIAGIAGILIAASGGILYGITDLARRMKGMSWSEVGAYLVRTLALAVFGTMNAIFPQFMSGLASIGSMLGTELINGLLSAFAGGSGPLAEGVRKLADSVKTSFKAALGIASKSKVFTRYGLEVGAGAVWGIDHSKDAVQAAADDMAPDLPRARRIEFDLPRPGRPGAAARGGDRSVNVGELHVHTAATDARGIAASIRDEVMAVLEGVAVEMGTEPDGLEPA